MQGVHNQMRDHLNIIAGQNPVNPAEVQHPHAPRRVELPPFVPWRIYLARHRQSYELIGPGVTACYAQFRSRNDANRRRAGGDQLRLDYVIERVDGLSLIHI